MDCRDGERWNWLGIVAMSSGNGGVEMLAPATTMLPPKRLQWFHDCEQECSIPGTSG
jgi:hypothetical protein